jgi:hypothetical protein
MDATPRQIFKFRGCKATNPVHQTLQLGGSSALTSKSRGFAIKHTLYSQCDILVYTLATITIASSTPAKLLSNQRVTAVELQLEMKGIPL